MSFDREKAFFKRLDIAAGTAVRFEPGDTKTVTLVQIAGNQVVSGASPGACTRLCARAGI